MLSHDIGCVLAGALTGAAVLLAMPGAGLDRLWGMPVPGGWPGCWLPPASRRSQAQPAPTPMPVVMELVAAVLDAGASPADALRTVGRCLREASDPLGDALLAASRDQQAVRSGPSRFECSQPGLKALLRALDLATVTGLGPAGLVRAAADEQRRRRATVQAVAAQRLAVHVMLPMALCLLPAFVLLAIAPIALGMLGATGK